MKKLTLLVIAIVFAISAFAQTVTKGTFTDQRDGQVYPTISFEDPFTGTSTTWMARNLNYKTSSGCWAYDNLEKYRPRLGLLYNHKTAQNVCPSGWHIATLGEWENLITEFSTTKLKSVKGWRYNGGNNSSGMDIMPAGRRGYKLEFDYIGFYARFWVQGYLFTNGGDIESFQKGIEINKLFGSDTVYKDYGLSVRCIKN